MFGSKYVYRTKLSIFKGVDFFDLLYGKKYIVNFILNPMTDGNLRSFTHVILPCMSTKISCSFIESQSRTLVVKNKR